MSEDNNVEEVVETEGSEVEATEEVVVKKAPVAIKIIRGRMPLPLVWHVRFNASAVGEDTIDEETAEVTPGTYASDSAVAKDMLFLRI